MTTIEDAFRQVTLAEADVRQRLVPAETIRVERAGLLTEDGQFRLDDAGLERFCRRVGAPARYLTRLERGVSVPLLQYHVDRGDLGDGPVTLITRRDRFLAFGRNDLTRLSGEQVLQAVLDGIRGVSNGLHVGSLAISEESFRLDLLSHEVSREIEPGDIVEAGLRIRHSMIGESATQIESFLLRLVCSNGMTHRECASSRAVRTRRLPVHHPEAVQLQTAQVRRLAEQVWSKLTEKLHAVQSLREERIHVAGFLERWLRQARLSARILMPLLREAQEQEGAGENVYTAVNSLTRVATHSCDVPVRQRQILSRLAGLIAFRKLHICPRCFSLLAPNEDRYH
jgi:hypothetical protein